MTLIEELVSEDALDLEEPIEEYPHPVGAPCEMRPGIARVTPYMRAGQALRAPRPKQTAFLCLRCLEAFYGGAAGGGKSDALLMAALQFVDVPGYAALLLRKTTQDLKLPGALIPRAESWLIHTDARWSASEKAWHFPSGAILQFGYCEYDADVMRYRSAEFQFIGIDETTQHTEFRYRYLFSRLRRPGNMDIGKPSLMDGRTTLRDVPLRMRSGSNPGDVGHGWVKRRLVDAETRRGPFIPAKTQDLEGIIDVPGYLRSLREMDPVNWMRYAHGDWEVRDPGEIFDITKFHLIEQPWQDDPRNIRRVRYWDMASTEPTKANKSPDWTVGLRLALNRATGKWCIEHIVRMRREPDYVEQVMRQTAETEPYVPIFIEQEPGSEGKAWINYVRRQVLRGFNARGDHPTGPKHQRIAMLQPIINSGDCDVLVGPWTQPFLDEVDAWPHTEDDHDDQLDALAGGHRALTAAKGRIIV